MDEREGNTIKLLRVRSLITVILIFISIFLLQIVAAFFGILIYNVMGMDIDIQDKTYIIFVSMLSALFSLGWCGFWYQRYRFRSEEFSYRKAFEGAKVLAMIGIGMGGCIAISILLSVLQQIFPAWFQGYEKTMSSFSQGNQVLTMLYALLIGPVSEEIIFRGVILNRLCLGFPFWLANLLQAALFGLYHRNLVQGLYAFALGFVLGLVWMMTRTILATMTVHVLFNSSNVILQQIFPEGKPISATILCTIFLLAVLFFSAGLWYTIRNCLSEEKNADDI